MDLFTLFPFNSFQRYQRYLAYLTTSNLLVGSIPEKMKKFTEGRILLGGNEKL
jgi:hypothetical protein